MIHRFILATLLAIIPQSLAAAAGDQKLSDLVAQRLSYMKDVAAYKYLNHLPIEDLNREEFVVDQAILAGLNQGIRVHTSRAFFTRQIDAAREIQEYWFDYWDRHSPPESAPNLTESIRPELIALGNEIIVRLGKQDATRRASSPLMASFELPGLSDESSNALIDMLDQIEFYDDRLDQITDSGILRVGTTGDYAPFSYRDNPDSDFSGIDIDLAKDLAQSLGVKLIFVLTSWPDLIDDLQSGRYDIAMSGVSRNLDRQKVGYFSRPYHTGGKTPIALCHNKKKLDSLAKIDQPNIKVIVNPGGTNEKFVNAHIRRAEKILHPDNRTIFQEIIHGNADVMITDSIEVSLVSSRHRELCATMEKNLTYLDKAYLMPQEQRLKEYVDLWLSLRVADGTVQSHFNSNLNQAHRN